MAATPTPFPVRLPPSESDPKVVPLEFPSPGRKRPMDAAHEHGPVDDRNTPPRDRDRGEPCPPEVYVG